MLDKDVNRTVKNNPNKFSDKYVIELNKSVKTNQ